MALRLSLSTAEENLSDANDEKRCLEKDVRLLTIEIQQAEAKVRSFIIGHLNSQEPTRLTNSQIA